MEFRQDCLLYRQLYHLILGTLLLLSILILWGSPLAEMPFLCLILYIPMLIGLAWCGCSGNRIRIDGNGIRCTHRQKILWAYDWTEIQALRCGRRSRYPVVIVVPKEPPVPDLHTPQSPPRLYFQADRKRRQQIKAMCPCAFEE